MIEESPFEAGGASLDLNPIGGLPVLVDVVEAGRVIVSEPRAILEYLDEVYAETDLMPDAPLDRAEARWAMGWLERGFDSDVNQTLLKERIVQRYLRAGRTDMGALRDGALALKGYMRHLEAIFAVRPYLAGENFTLADVCAAAHLSCLDYFGDVPWDAFANTREWYMRMKSRRSFRSLLKDNLQGVAPAAHYSQLDF